APCRHHRMEAAHAPAVRADHGRGPDSAARTQALHRRCTESAAWLFLNFPLARQLECHRTDAYPVLAFHGMRTAKAEAFVEGDGERCCVHCHTWRLPFDELRQCGLPERGADPTALHLWRDEEVDEMASITQGNYASEYAVEQGDAEPITRITQIACFRFRRNGIEKYAGIGARLEEGIHQRHDEGADGLCMLLRRNDDVELHGSSEQPLLHAERMLRQAPRRGRTSFSFSRASRMMAAVVSQSMQPSVTETPYLSCDRSAGMS